MDYGLWTPLSSRFLPRKSHSLTPSTLDGADVICEWLPNYSKSPNLLQYTRVYPSCLADLIQFVQYSIVHLSTFLLHFYLESRQYQNCSRIAREKMPFFYKLLSGVRIFRVGTIEIFFCRNKLSLVRRYFQHPFFEKLHRSLNS